MYKNKRVLIAIIAYNEEKNIGNAIRDLKEHDIGYDIVVIDNGSADKTVEVCRELGVPVVAHCVNSGRSSGTLMTYFLYAFRNNYDVLCQFDGDAQHIASELPKIIDPVIDEGYDYVVGSRFLEKKGYQSYYFRRIAINLFSKIDSKIIRQQVTDVTSGFRAYSRKVIEYMAKCHRHETFGFNQVLLLSYFMKAKIKEVPVQMQERQHGTSEFHFFSAITFILQGFVVIAGTLLQRKQIERNVQRFHGS